jgi:hypothetical protein
MPPGKWAVSWKKVCSEARTMSERSQRSSVEGPPFTVSKEVALVTRTDGIRQELHDRLRLLEIISEVRLDQLSHTFRALANSPLVAPPLAETQIVGGPKKNSEENSEK